MSDRRTEGLYGKFIVQRTDGRDVPGEKHDGCTYFVLDLQHDKHMPAALHAYADSCASEYPVLASQLHIVANDFGSRAEFAGIMAQKPALDLERQRAAALDAAPSCDLHALLEKYQKEAFASRWIDSSDTGSVLKRFLIELAAALARSAPAEKK